MASVREKWKRGFEKAKLTRKDSSQSVISSMNSAIMEDDISENEVGAYLSRLKKKTGLKNLWSGNKFTNYVDGDRTPDISTDSDEELDLKLSKNPDYLRQLTLDSDEDEMRIDFMREAKEKTDRNNNMVNSDDDNSGPLNLMQNIHFAELAINDVDLNDNELKAEKPKDYLPQLYAPNFEEVDEKSSASDASYVFGKNIHVLDENEISEEESTSHVSRDSIKTELVHTAKEVSEEEEGEMASVSENSKPLESSRSELSSKHTKKNYSQSSFETDNSSPRRKRENSKASSKRRARSKTDKISSFERSESEASTLASTSSISSSRTKLTKESKKVKSTSSRLKKEKRHSDLRRNSQSASAKKNVHTQTQCVNTDDLTEEVLKFRYSNNGNARPSNPVRQTVDTAVMDALTAYNPTVLAANDMLKFHLDLLKQHIDNSNRLYEAYASESFNSNYKYTTFEDTMKFIQRNRPTVIKFEDALKEVQKLA